MPLKEDTVLLQDKVDVVNLKIKVDGKEISRQYQVQTLTILQGINKIPSASLMIIDGDASEQDFLISSSDEFLPGKKIGISLGYLQGEGASDTPFLFTGIIITNTHKVNNHCCELSIECKHETEKMTINKSNSHYKKNVTATEIARDLLEEKNHLSNYDIDEVALKHEQLMQANVSDWDFMISRIDLAGMICVINNDIVRIKVLKVETPPENESGEMLQLVHGRNILELSADKDSRLRNDEVKVVTWDFKEQKVSTSSNSQSVAGTNETQGKPVSNSYEIRSATTLSQEEGDQLAKTKKLKQELSVTKGKVKYIGRTDVHLLPGDFVELSGVGENFSGYHFVSAVQQDYSDGCWTTEATLGWNEQFFSEQTNPQHASSVMGQTSTLQGLQIGIVTSIEDADGQYRVRVKMPLHANNEEGFFARVATLDAGKDRGTFFRPEVDDEVILGFINEDPSSPVILGMLHSSAKPAPLEPEKNNAQKGYTSRSAIQLLFDDEKKSVTIKTPGGRVFEMNDESGTITLKDGDGNKLVMEQAGISIEAAQEVAIKAGTNLSLQATQISIKADASLEAKGSASAKLEGGGQTEIKGGIVKIN